MSDDDKSAKSGFGNPPSQRRFKQGESGNPKGRPKGSRNLKTDLSALLKGKVEITINGRTRRIRRQEAMLLSLYQRALSKDSGAAKTLIDLVVKLQNPDDDSPVETTNSPSDRIIVENYLRRNGYAKSGETND
jgi:hypothetical protein